MKKIQGLIVAPFTGMAADGSIRPETVHAQAELFKRNGVKGAFVCGTTGESSALTLAEKEILLAAWAPHQSQEFDLIAFVGGTSVQESMHLAARAESLGYTGVAYTAPYYIRPKSIQALKACCKQVAAAAPLADFYYYHIPCFTGVDFPMIDLLQAMDADIPNLGGIKYTHENMMDYQLCLNFKNKKYNIMWGRDEMFLEALALGAVSAVGSTYNYSSNLYNAIQKAFASGNHALAADLQYKAVEFITLLGKYGQSTGKAIMKQMGMNLGTHRLPALPLSEAQEIALKQDMDQMDFFAFSSK